MGCWDVGWEARMPEWDARMLGWDTGNPELEEVSQSPLTFIAKSIELAA